mmetsp:Transcript_36448/g.86278  ORF Transcript_36448/g.86278 Transcript_36448/m.86278 type:complete len:337 (-) Transcript_36448:539-1549(-)
MIPRCLSCSSSNFGRHASCRERTSVPGRWRSADVRETCSRAASTRREAILESSSAREDAYPSRYEARSDSRPERILSSTARRESTPGRQWRRMRSSAPAARASESATESSVPSETHTTNTPPGGKYCSACRIGHQSSGSSALSTNTIPSASLRSAVETMSASFTAGASITSRPASSASLLPRNTSRLSTSESDATRMSSHEDSRHTEESRLPWCPSSDESSTLSEVRKGKAFPWVRRCSRSVPCTDASVISSSVRSSRKWMKTTKGSDSLFGDERYRTVTLSLKGQSRVSIPRRARTRLRFIRPAEPERKSLSCESHMRWIVSRECRWQSTSPVLS